MGPLTGIIFVVNSETLQKLCRNHLSVTNNLSTHLSDVQRRKQMKKSCTFLLPCWEIVKLQITCFLYYTWQRCNETLSCYFHLVRPDGYMDLYPDRATAELSVFYEYTDTWTKALNPTEFRISGGKYSHACPKCKLKSALVGIYGPPEQRSNVAIPRATRTQSPQRFLRRETHLLEMGSQISASSLTPPSRSWKKYNGVYGTSITPLIPLPSSTRRRGLRAVWAGRLQASMWEPGANGSAGYCKVMKGLALLRWCEWCSLRE